MTDVIGTTLAPAPGVDIDLSLLTFGTPPPDVIGIQKDQQDLMRYRRIIASTSPDVIIECGTDTGYSANWFARLVPHVITIDVDVRRVVAPHNPDRVTRVIGSSTDPLVVDAVATMVAGRRIMVSLDAEHTPHHVEVEIGLWAPLVSPGCYLVVEDGIYHWKPDPNRLDWDPLTAISRTLPRMPEFERDLRIEGLYPITGSPAGWWLRR